MNPAAIIAVIILMVLVVAFGPLATIWALNLLFGLTIPYTFWTWLATLWLGMVFNPVRSHSKD